MLSNMQAEKIFVGNNRRFDLNIYQWGLDSPLRRGYVHGPLIRDHFTVQYVYTGRGMLILDKQEYQLEQGQLFVTFPDMLIEERADRNTPWRLMWIGFQSENADAYLRNIGATREQPVLPMQCGAEELKYFEKIVGTGKSEDSAAEFSRIAYTCLLFNALGEAAERCGILRTPSRDREGYIFTAIRFMESRYYEDIKITDIAAHVGLERSYFYKLFKEQVKVSPKEYLMYLRIKKACVFLTAPGSSIANVANSVGYDPVVFSRVFKQVTGVTPTQYRKEKI